MVGGKKMLKVFGRVKSRAFRVVWLLEELEAPYDLTEIAPRSEEAKKVYKNGKIPFVLDDGVLISDSVAILTYLSDKHKEFTQKAGSIERARQDSITFRILDEFEALLWVAAKHTYVFSDDKKVPDIINTLKWEFANNQEKFVTEYPLNQNVCGENFLIPDILLGHCLVWAESMNFSICEELLAYFNRLKERPAYRKAYALR